LAEENFQGTTEIVCSIADNYFRETESVSSTWANYINENELTIEEAMHYLESVRISDDIYAQVIWADDYSGYSRESHLSDRENFSVSYAGRTQLFSGWTDKKSLFVTPHFTNPVTGSFAIAFCKQIFLMDNDTMREAILMRIIPNDVLKTRWVFPSGYASAGVSIIDENGKYVLKDNSMKNEDFFSFIYSYNQGVINQTALKELVKSQTSGKILADNALGQECMWSFRHLDTNSNWTAVMSATCDDIYEKGPDWVILVSIYIILAMLFAGDMFYFILVKKKDERVQKMLSEQGEQLKSALESAEQANRAKTSFLFNMSHDIRTPMNAIIGFRDLLEKHQDEPLKRQDYLDKIKNSNEVLLSIINNVLEMTRIEQGKIELDETPGEVNSFCDEMKTMFTEMMEEKKLSYSVSCNVSHPYIFCDTTKLREIYINLISNAYKYTNPGGHVTVTVDELPYDKDGYTLIRTCIADSGIGMSEEFIPHIFEEFARENSTTDAKVEGTGLGMPIVKRLVDLLGGTIEVNSKKGTGTTFYVSIPHRIADEK
ncbi:MAG: HAMP domain-containing sensor histidine kinase, partial [Clostridia bacterium]|nr:HAMP domain-containing sensor histidine kinase [Clostridia bacterium]